MTHGSARRARQCLLGVACSWGLLAPAAAQAVPTGLPVPVATSASSAPDSGSGMSMTSAAAGCVVGATVGTAIFPGIGSAAGCAAVGALSYLFGPKVLGWFSPQS